MILSSAEIAARRSEVESQPSVSADGFLTEDPTASVRS